MTSTEQTFSDYLVFIIDVQNHFITTYFALINGTYLFMLVVAFFAINKHLHHVQSLKLNNLVQSPFAKPISLIVPAYNEEATIIGSVKSLLQLQYSLFEIILINDGSKDQTLNRLIESFNLIKTKMVVRKLIPCQEVKGVYQSLDYPKLIVIDKKNGGKADALNAGINSSKFPLICCIDADSVLEPDVLGKMVRPFIEDTTTVAAGGSIRIANGCEIFNGRVKKIGLPKSLIAKFQIMEYLRAFLAGRMAFSAINGLLIISGAFGIFKKDKVIEVGGYATNTVGEDIELIVRLHAHLGEKKEPYSFYFIPDPVCWTEAPEDLRVLSRQRTRWQRGLLESLLRHQKMLFNPKYGVIGLFVHPFSLFVEGFGPIIEFFGITIFVVSYFFQMVGYPLLIIFFLVTIVLNILLSMGALIFEEMTFGKYPKFSMILKLIALSVVEVFIYRPINSWFRLVGLFQYLSGKKGGWGMMTRKGF